MKTLVLQAHSVDDAFGLAQMELRLNHSYRGAWRCTLRSVEMSTITNALYYYVIDCYPI